VAITTTIASVTTEDAAPTTAPHKVSLQSGKTNATVAWTPTHPTGQAITCYRIEVGGAAPGTGTILAWGGFPCSDSLPESLCSDSDASVSCTDGLAAVSGVQRSNTVSGASLTGGDGAKTVNIYAGAADTALG
jgi:hypothetical protein